MQSLELNESRFDVKTRKAKAKALNIEAAIHVSIVQADSACFGESDFKESMRLLKNAHLDAISLLESINEAQQALIHLAYLKDGEI